MIILHLALLLAIIIVIAFIIWIILNYKYYSSKDWRKIPITEYIEKDIIGPYYVSLKEKMVDYPYRDRYGGILDINPLDNSKFFHPIQNSHYCMALYETYLESKDESLLDEMIKIGDAIIKNGVDTDYGGKVWPLPLQFHKNQKLPWISAMYQGSIIGALVRLYEVNPKEEYIEVARKALKAFTIPISKGGVISDDSSQGAYYEEYAYREIDKQRHTLNGMLAALFGIYDFWKMTKDEEARSIFDKGVKVIRENLIKFDWPFCSVYDLRYQQGEVPIINPRYNAVHIAQLRVLAKMTGDDYFAAFADLWELKLKDRINRLRITIHYFRFKIDSMWKEAQWLGFSKMLLYNFRRLMIQFREFINRRKRHKGTKVLTQL